MKILSAILLIGLTALPGSADGKCTQGCTLTIRVKACDGTPLEGIPIELKLKCKREHLEGKTDKNGEAKFAVCISDVQEKKIGSLVQRIVKGGGSGERDTVIEVTQCDE